MITLEEAKAWIRVDIDDDDALILSLVEAAKQWYIFYDDVTAETE